MTKEMKAVPLLCYGRKDLFIPHDRFTRNVLCANGTIAKTKPLLITRGQIDLLFICQLPLLDPSDLDWRNSSVLSANITEIIILDPSTQTVSSLNVVNQSDSAFVQSITVDNILNLHLDCMEMVLNGTIDKNTCLLRTSGSDGIIGFNIEVTFVK